MLLGGSVFTVYITILMQMLLPVIPFDLPYLSFSIDPFIFPVVSIDKYLLSFLFMYH